MANEGLNARQQAIVPIAAFTASGDIDRLKTALTEGLDAGLTVNEIKEVIVQLYAYSGFPRSLNGLGAFMEVLKEREQAGIKDPQGKEAGPLPTDKSLRELGTEIQTHLAGAPVQGSLFDFAPAIDHFLKDHLFGDIFGRDNLSFQDREIATIAALAGMSGVNSQLQAHINIGMNVGLTESQINDLIAVLGAKVSQPVASNAADILANVVKARQQ